MNAFDRWNNAIRQSEASLVNLLSAVAPWGAPLAPAYMSYGGMVAHLGFAPWIAFILAAVIEILGLATVHTTLIFWQHNRRYKAEYKRQPTELAAGMFIFYLSVVLVVNVILELPGEWEYTPIIARALLTLLSFPAAVIMAIRTQHTELLAEIHAPKMQPNATKQATTQPVAQPANNRLRILEMHHAAPDTPHADIAQAVGVSRQYVDKIIKANGYQK